MPGYIEMVCGDKLSEVKLAPCYVSTRIDPIPRAPPIAETVVVTHICHDYSVLGRGGETLDANREKVHTAVFDDISPEHNHTFDGTLNLLSDDAGYTKRNSTF